MDSSIGMVMFLIVRYADSDCFYLCIEVLVVSRSHCRWSCFLLSLGRSLGIGLPFNRNLMRLDGIG
jgi:hypothetical protein